MDPNRQLEAICRRHRLAAVYLFGSRAEDGRNILLAGRRCTAAGSDLDVGVYFVNGEVDTAVLGPLQADLGDVFEPVHVDLVPLDRVDPFFPVQRDPGIPGGGARLQASR